MTITNWIGLSLLIIIIVVGQIWKWHSDKKVASCDGFKGIVRKDETNGEPFSKHNSK